MKDADRDNAGNEADQASEHDEPPIVLDRKAGENAEHAISLHRQYCRWWMG
ncbi:hypothetical protein [Bradyrhizobium japonicum]|uniref:hypothetical protein n=1 Tax=Bradyrhizobium japonicum TaxID=375 RepID=UPI0020113979|nr:hypothetical protein [Bradyrhizobium japonicum]